MLPRSYCRFLGYWWAIAAQRKHWLKVRLRAKIKWIWSLVDKKGNLSPNISREPTKRNHIHHSPVISSISSEARVSYLCCVALTLPFGNSNLLRVGCDATVESVKTYLPESRERRGHDFFFVSPPSLDSTPTQVVPGRERKKCSSTPSFSNSAHYAQLDVNVHI